MATGMRADLVLERYIPDGKARGHLEMGGENYVMSTSRAGHNIEWKHLKPFTPQSILTLFCFSSNQI